MDRQKYLMQTLGISAEEAKQLMEDDAKIDKGEKLFELSADQKKVEKKMRQADRKSTVYKLEKRERKPNEDKRALISIFTSTLNSLDDLESVEIINPERQIDFKWNGTRYRIVLSAPRK